MKRRILIGGLALAVVLCAIVVVGLKIAAPAFDDSDLKPNFGNVSSNENGFALLEKASAAVYCPSNQESQIIDLSGSFDTTSLLFQQVLASNQVAIALFLEVAKSKFIRVAAEGEWGEEYPSYLLKWRHLSQISRLRSTDLFQIGREEEGLAVAMNIVQIGHLMENCGGDLIHFQVGSAVKSVGLGQMKKLVENSKLPRDRLIDQIVRLESFRVNAAGLSNSFKVEYQKIPRRPEGAAKGQVPGISPSDVRLPGWSLFFSASRSKQKFAEATRISLAFVPERYVDMKFERFPQARTNVAAVLKGNAVGEIVYDLQHSVPKHLLEHKCRDEASVIATQILIALRCYQLKHGILPDNLSELTRTYLAKEP